MALPDDNPFQPPVDDPAPPTVQPAAIGAKRVWIAFAGWISASCVLSGTFGPVGLATSTSQLRGLELAAQFVAPIAVRLSAGEIVSMSAALAVVTAAHGRVMPATIAARWTAFHRVFLAAPVAAVPTAALVVVLWALTLSAFGSHVGVFLGRAATSVALRDVAFGLAMTCARAAVCGAVVMSGLALLTKPRWLVVRIVLTWLAVMLAMAPLAFAAAWMAPT